MTFIVTFCSVLVVVVSYCTPVTPEEYGVVECSSSLAYYIRRSGDQEALYLWNRVVLYAMMDVLMSQVQLFYFLFFFF